MKERILNKYKELVKNYINGELDAEQEEKRDIYIIERIVSQLSYLHDLDDLIYEDIEQLNKDYYKSLESKGE